MRKPLLGLAAMALAGLCVLGAIFYQANKDFTPWMSLAELNHFLAQFDSKPPGQHPNYWDNGHWIDAVEARWHEGIPQYRLRYGPTPPGCNCTWYWYINQDQTSFSGHVHELADQGMVLLDPNSYLRPDHTRRYQGVWHLQKPKSATPVPAASSPATAPGPSADAVEHQRRQTLIEGQMVTANPSVFPGDDFPKIDFVNRDLIRRALGPYTLGVRYFDAGWQEVTHPSAQGRYGALVAIHFDDGVSDTRHLTLYHVARGYSPAHDAYHATLRFPSAFSLPADIDEIASWNIDKYANDALDAARGQDDYYAAFLAALQDAAADPGRFRGFEYIRIDNMWWQELEKRQGLTKAYRKLVRLPEGYDQAPGKKWPLILFLHGSGERGDDLSVLKGRGPAGYAEGGHSLPFIVVTPQCLKRERWDPALLLDLVDEMEKTYRVDPSRVYVTGLSMGGIGALDLAATYPGKFAALAALSARENPEIAPRLQRIPVWIFHGTLDETVPTHYGVDLAAALKKQGGPVKITLLPGVGHGGWDKVYADPALYDWFLQYPQ